MSMNKLILPLACLLVCAVLLLLPAMGVSGFILTLLTQIMIASVLGLSYNMLFGQSGMLSFGHAVYYGFGIFVTLHLLDAIGEAGLPIPLELVPLIGAAAGLLSAMIFGSICTLRGGMAFAMITLAIGEMVVAASVVFPDFFGGAMAITADRVLDFSLTGFSYGPQWQVYLLVAVWAMIAALLMYLHRDTSQGWAAVAVRDNEERARFLGYNPQRVRYMQFVLAGLFAGIAGGLYAVTFEGATTDLLGLAASADILLGVFLGGRKYFLGPVVGVIFVTLLRNYLSDMTPAWYLYNGMLFIVMVAFAPQGLVGLIVDGYNALRTNRLADLLGNAGRNLMSAAPLLLGLIVMIEFAYRRSVARDPLADIPVLGFNVAPASIMPWIIGGALLALAAVAYQLVARANRNNAVVGAAQ